MKFDAALVTSSLRDVPAIAQAAESLGFDGLWTTETAHNPYLPLTLAASASNRLELGTAISLAFPRSPMVTAQIAWDLAEQSSGRFILGLGTQIKPHIVRRFSTTWDKPGPRLRDYILSLRAIWNTFQTSAPLSYKGEFYQFTLMTPFFSPGRINTPDIPIYIAGVNSYLCRLAGELCQGFHVHPFHTVKYLRGMIIPNIEQGAAAAGRTRADIQTACGIFVVTGADDREIADNIFAVKAQIAFYASTPSYLPVLETHGWADLHEKLNLLSRRGEWAEMANLISDEMLHEFAVVATHDQLARKVRERYEGLLDRIMYYFPFEAAKNEALWRDAVAVLSDKSK
ncbi:MAG: TIGR03617 family F420-dependent LLM class oxidoreductase [Anaerolineae bacterium]|nr:TIGR03617 family F420-dependent LLM class oxidoreductase [Anaerolineae bacterium]